MIIFVLELVNYILSFSIQVFKCQMCRHCITICDRCTVEMWLLCPFMPLIENVTHSNSASHTIKLVPEVLTRLVNVFYVINALGF